MEFLADTNVWVAISFALFALLVYTKATGPIGSGLDSKINAIKKEIEAAENMRVEAQELLAQYQRKNLEAEKQANDIIANAKKRVEQLKKDAQQSIESDMKRRENQLEQRISLMEEKAFSDLKARTSQLTLLATKEIVTNAMTQKENERLNKEIMGDLSSKTLH